MEEPRSALPAVIGDSLRQLTPATHSLAHQQQESLPCEHRRQREGRVVTHPLPVAPCGVTVASPHSWIQAVQLLLAQPSALSAQPCLTS